MVRWDGSLTVCCNDSQLALSLGSLATESFGSLWTGPKAEALRDAHLKGNFAMEPCARCPNQRYPTLSDDEIAEYLLARGR